MAFCYINTVKNLRIFYIGFFSVFIRICRQKNMLHFVIHTIKVNDNLKKKISWVILDYPCVA